MFVNLQYMVWFKTCLCLQDAYCNLLLVGMNACMYAHMYVYIDVCMYQYTLFTYVSIYLMQSMICSLCTYRCMNADMHAHKYVYTYVCIYVLTHMIHKLHDWLHLCAFMYVYMYASIYMIGHDLFHKLQPCDLHVCFKILQRAEWSHY
jgi:hypothetical protein